MDGREDHQAVGAQNGQPVEGQSLFRRLEGHVWRRMLAGFLVLVPLLVTFVVLRVFINFTDNLVRPNIIQRFGKDSPLDFYGVGVVISVVLLYLVGAIVASKVGRRVVDWQHAILNKVPVVGSITGVARQATDALSAPMDHHFSRVVFIEWPQPGTRALGFVTGHLRSGGSDGKIQVAVYIPTVPNPTSGMLAFVSEEDIIETDITLEEAMKLVFSGGIVLPDLRARVSLRTPNDGPPN